MIEITDFTLNAPGVYLLLNDIELIYVGKTKHLNQRLQTHKTGGWFYYPKDFNRVFFEEIYMESDRKSFENKMIDEYYPKYNCEPDMSKPELPSDEEVRIGFDKIKW
jgi:excinuclease UvrABC nuclease subunit